MVSRDSHVSDNPRDSRSHPSGWVSGVYCSIVSKRELLAGRELRWKDYAGGDRQREKRWLESSIKFDGERYRRDLDVHLHNIWSLNENTIRVPESPTISSLVYCCNVYTDRLLGRLVCAIEIFFYDSAVNSRLFMILDTGRRSRFVVIDVINARSPLMHSCIGFPERLVKQASVSGVTGKHRRFCFQPTSVT